eukprot:TRINITY_DN13457_c0_g1_i1.p1 TRINITY_DN13457_c0_g1~~TRINITY_DN13457_c0_g1_i1.p1  ORF type:complete len:412 (+),score=44.86 TRINITY_DN13457_c0_g1_i1:46-1281(+)
MSCKLLLAVVGYVFLVGGESELERDRWEAWVLDTSNATDPPVDETPVGNETMVPDMAPFDDNETAAPSTAAPDTEAPPTPSPQKLCGYDERVLKNICVPCEIGLLNAPGDDPSGSNTNCSVGSSYVFGILVVNTTDKTPPPVFVPSSNLLPLMSEFFLRKDPTSRNLTFRQLCTYGQGDLNVKEYPGTFDRCALTVPGEEPVACEQDICDYVIWSSIRTTDDIMLLRILTDPSTDWKAMGLNGAVRYLDHFQMVSGSTKVVTVDIERDAESDRSVFRQMVAQVAGVPTAQVSIYKFGLQTSWFQVVNIDSAISSTVERILKDHLNASNSWIASSFKTKNFALREPLSLTTNSTSKDTPLWGIILLCVIGGIFLLAAVVALVLFSSCFVSEDEKMETIEYSIRETKYRTTMV